MIQQNVVSLPKPFISSRPFAAIRRDVTGEEKFNVASHLAGALLSGIGTLALVLPALEMTSPAKALGFAVYGLCTVCSYLASVAYHATRGGLRRRLRRFDRATIYFAIAGCYTPIVLIDFRSIAGMAALASVWGMAIVSSMLELRPRTGYAPRSIVPYIVMGSGFLASWKHLMVALTPQGLTWLFAACAIYLVGALVLCCRRIPRHHEIWHVFVLAGNACTFVVMRYYLA